MTNFEQAFLEQIGFHTCLNRYQVPVSGHNL